MAIGYWNRVKQLSSTQGTGSYALGAEIAGFRTFADVMAIGQQTVIAAVGAAGFEIIEVELINSTTLSRGTVLANSLGNTSKIDWPDNAAKELFVVVPAEYAAATNRENIWQANQLFRAFKAAFGATGNATVGGSDTEIRIDVGPNAALVMLSNGDCRIEVDLDDGTSGRGLILQVNSASPGAGDLLYQLALRGKDSAGGTQTYARVRAKIATATAGEHEGRLELAVPVNGTLTDAIVIDGSTSPPSVTVKSAFAFIDEA